LPTPGRQFAFDGSQLARHLTETLFKQALFHDLAHPFRVFDLLLQRAISASCKDWNCSQLRPSRSLASAASACRCKARIWFNSASKVVSRSSPCWMIAGSSIRSAVRAVVGASRSWADVGKPSARSRADSGVASASDCCTCSQWSRKNVGLADQLFRQIHIPAGGIIPRLQIRLRFYGSILSLAGLSPGFSS